MHDPKAIEEILARVKPVIASVLARNRTAALREEDLDDIAATVNLRLVRRLQSSGTEPIANIDDFTARLTYNAVYEVLRRRFPRRTQLKNQLRYTLTRDPRFATWTVGDASVAGLHKWSGRDDVAREPSLQAWQSTARMLDAERPAEAIEAVLQRLGKPLLLNDLAGIFAELWGVTDAVPEDVAEASHESTPLQQLESKQQLSLLWREIEALSPQQRAALLLNLRDVDGHNAASLFVLLGVAGIEELAAAMEMTTAQLAEIWNELPIDDLRIASLLGKTRQQVINLRKSARERLARRMKNG